MKRVAILGAAGRDFHNFNVVFRGDPDYRVVAFTATQIPGIEDRRYPCELAGSAYPDGIPIIAEEELEEWIVREKIDVVVFSYSDVAAQHVMKLAARSMSSGADFWLLAPENTQIRCQLPLLSVCAVRTGCGKSQTARRLASILTEMGFRLAVIRHPMPYGDLRKQAVQRFGNVEDLDRHECTIEEREEYEPHLGMGTIVYAGIDYEQIIRRAEKEVDVVLWDGGNNDTPFYHSQLEIVVLDPLRAGHELTYFPGEVNLRRADVALINKVNTASDEDVSRVRSNIEAINPSATIVEGDSLVLVSEPKQIRGKRVLVIEDGPTLTHGEMSYGAGVVAARENGAAELVDPRPYARGSISQVFAQYPHLENLLPAMGYGDIQRQELEDTINATPCDLVLIATPVDLASIVSIDRPHQRVTYELRERSRPDFSDLLADFVSRYLTNSKSRLSE